MSGRKTINHLSGANMKITPGKKTVHVQSANTNIYTMQYVIPSNQTDTWTHGCKIQKHTYAYRNVLS